MVQCEDLKDDDQPSNILELFSELDEVLEMIEKLKSNHSQSFEKDYEKFSEVLSRYQEQPHLLDPHLELLLNKLLGLITDPNSSKDLVDGCFKYLYTISKVRTYKCLVKFLPHELADLEFVLDMLEKQDANDSQHWETRYILLLWLSILVLNPFHMARLDVYQTQNSFGENDSDMPIKTKMERIYDLCRLYSENNDTCANVASYLSAKYLVRTDIKEIYLEKFLKWVMEQHDALTVSAKFGQLSAIAAILKHGKREDLLPYADMILRWILSCNYKESSDFLKYRYYMKIIQRIGLVYLKPRVATWRYKRGSRSLVANLANLQEDSPTEEVMDANNVSIESEEVSVPDSIEDVIEELLQGLRSSSSDVRWSAAKGLGRVTNRLPKSLGDEVVGSVIEIFNPLEPHEAWHGACLAIAELAKRGLLLPYRLSVMVPLLTQAMFYDEMKGYMSVGQHIRDASCYMCWAFARAYDPKDFQPFVMEIAAGLLTAAVFDREINCRRAASAAFQESVGRLGNFPHGIDISTTTDFYSVGLRTNSYLNISNYIAQFEEYTRPLIDHLIEKKVGHWDTSIRELSAKALHNLTKQDPNYMCVEVLPKLFAKTDSIDIATRHGSVFAIGEICLALRDVESSRSDKLLTNQILSELNELVGKFVKKDQFRGMSGEITKQCCTDLIKNCSKARIDVTSECLESWQQVIDKCIVNKNAQIREAATGALSELCKAYYNASERSAENAAIVEAYLKGSENDLDQHIRMGFVSAIGTLPKFMLTPKLNEVIHSLIKHSLPPHGVREAVINGDKNTRASYENTITCNWSEARRDSVKALTNIVQTVGFDGIETESIANPQYLNRITDCYLKALEEYTLDNRGDIGAWVREAAMCALFNLLINCPNHLLNADIIHQVMVGLAQQAVEKIDRTRGLAGKFFCNLVHATPSIPHIKRHDKLLTIFPQDSSTVLWLFADHTFPLFCVLLELPEYSERVLLGLSASIGQLTESLIKYSSSSLFQFLRSHTSEVPRICSEIVSVFQQNSMNERVTYPMLNFLDILLSSGTINRVLVDESSTFADDIFRLVNLEIKGHKKLYKLVSSINVFCQLIQVPRLCGKILSKMSVFLGLTHVHIRKTSATKLYEALALHGDNCGISEEILDEILTILSETDWGMPLVDVRPIRNKLCDLMGVKAPISAATAAPK